MQLLRLFMNILKISDLLRLKKKRFIIPRSTIDFLFKENKINKDLYYKFMPLYSFKNEFVHGARDPNLEDLKNRISFLKQLNNELKEKFNL